MPKLKSLPQTKVRPQSSDSELRGKYQTLPPIRIPEETYEEWKKKYELNTITVTDLESRLGIQTRSFIFYGNKAGIQSTFMQKEIVNILMII